MARRRVRRSYGRVRRRFRAPKTIPIAPIAGLVGGALFTGPKDWGPTINYITAANAGTKEGMEAIGRVLLNNFTGIEAYSSGGANVDVVGIINPFDLNHAGAIKGFLWGMIAHKAANMLGGNRIMARLPAPLNKVRI